MDKKTPKDMSLISIIVCSRTPKLSIEMQRNIADSIGTDYELIVIDNSKHEYDIFTAYNEGVRKSVGDILCFVHDDVLFRCNNWGTIIIEHFCDSKIGLIGIEGAHFLPSVPMYWPDSPFVTEHSINTSEGVTQEFFHGDYYNASGLAEVVCVDGMCFFIRRTLFEYISFDCNTYHGFHMYDMDICMQINKAGYKVCVTKNILIEHFWSYKKFIASRKDGVFDNNLKVFTKKWQPFLPIHRGIDNIITSDSLSRINQLCYKAYDSWKARNSNSYKIGRTVLAPLRYIKHKLSDS